MSDTLASQNQPDPWWQHLRGRPFYWALDGSHPAADLLMLREVLERPVKAPPVAEARLALREWPVVQAGIAELATIQAPLALLWRLRHLGEWGLSGDDARIAEAIDHLLDHPLTGLSFLTNPTAILLSVPLAFGFGSDPRATLLMTQLCADIAANRWPTAQADQAAWMTQALIALSLVTNPTPMVEATRQTAASALLALDPATLPAHWHQLGTPVGNQPDILAASRALIRCGIYDARLTPWVAAVAARQSPEGGWVLRRLAEPADSPLSHIEEMGQPSRWLSAQALSILRHFHGE